MVSDGFEYENVYDQWSETADSESDSYIETTTNYSTEGDRSLHAYSPATSSSDLEFKSDYTGVQPTSSGKYEWTFDKRVDSDHNGAGDPQFAIEDDNGDFIRIRSNLGENFALQSSFFDTVDTGLSVSKNTWYSIKLVIDYENDVVTLYIDGNEEASASLDGNSLDSSSSYFWGKVNKWSGSGDYAEFWIDDIETASSDVFDGSLDTKVYDDGGTESYSHEIGDPIEIEIDATHNTGNRDNIDKVLMTLEDSTGTKQIDSAEALQFLDEFGGDESDWDDQTSDDEYEVTGGEYVFGYTGDYQEFTLVDDTVLDNKETGTWKVDMNVVDDAEHTSRLVVQYQDSDNYVALFISHHYSVMGIEEYIDGSRSVTEVSKPIETDQYYELKLSIEDGTARAYLDGNMEVERELESSFGTGRQGLCTDASEVHYNNYSVGYEDSETSEITDGIRSTFYYDIPSDTGLAGSWLVTAEAVDSDGNLVDETNFDVSANIPTVLKDNMTVTDSTNNFAGEERKVQAKILHSTPSDLDTIQVDIYDPTGTQQVTDGSASEIEEGDNYKIYEYAYTPPKSKDSEGEWDFDYYADDVDGDSDQNSDVFDVKVPYPNFSKKSYEVSDAERYLVELNESGTLNAKIYDREGGDNVDGVDITIKNRQGDTVESGSMTLDSTDGDYAYFSYDFDFSYDNNDSLGKYLVELTASDPDYSKYSELDVQFIWSQRMFFFRKSIDITEIFWDGEEEFEDRKETVTFDVSAEDGKIDETMMRLVDERGIEIPYEVIDTSSDGNTKTITVKVDLPVNESYTDGEVIDLYMYYDYQNIPDQTSSVSAKNVSIGNFNLTEIDAYQFWDTVTEDDQVSHTNAVDSGDPLGDGSTKRFVIGRSQNESNNNHGTVIILDEEGNIDNSYRMQIQDESAWISGMLVDVDDDGEDELIVAGWSYDSEDDTNWGVVAIYSYDGTDLTQEHEDLYNYDESSPVHTNYYAVEVGDFDDDGDMEVAVCGRNNDVNPATVRIYDNTLSFIDDAKSGFDTDRDRLFALAHGDIANDGTTKILANGTTDTGNTNPDGHFILDATMGIYDFDGSTLTREFEMQWNITDYDSDYDEDMTETFGNDVGDADDDGDYEIVTSGNFYDYDNDRDVSDIRIWSYDGTDVTREDSIYEPASGHSSIFTIKVVDLIGDGNNELVGVGFYNDGTQDRGKCRVYNYDGDFNLLDSAEITMSSPVRDGDYHDAVDVFRKDNGMYVITSGGTIGRTPPMKAFFRTREVGGVETSLGSEERFSQFVSGHTLITKDGNVVTESGVRKTEKPS